MSEHLNAIIVASLNPVKLTAVRIGVAALFPDLKPAVTGISVPSGVADQPMSDQETVTGAANRVANARRAVPAADCWVGIEGGIEDDGTTLLALAWVVVETVDGRRGRARTGSFPLPLAVAQLVRDGKELGEADDIVFGQSNSKQKQGAVGLLTGGSIDRAGLYAHAVTLALIPILNRDLTF